MQQIHSRRAVLAGVGAATLTAAPARAAAARYRLVGEAPWFPNLAAVMDRSPELMNQLATEFAPTAAKLATQKIYFLAFNGWMNDRLTGLLMEGKAGPGELRAYAWAIYASAYWNTLELQKTWGVPMVIGKMGFKTHSPRAEDVQAFVDKLAARQALLASGHEACLRALPDLLRDTGTTGIVQGMAYNSGVQVVKNEAPPLGQRPAHIRAEPGAVRINTRDFMRVDYAFPAPGYLRRWRTTFDGVARAQPEDLEKALAGGSDRKDLRALWRDAVELGHANWGGGATSMWDQAYYTESIRWSSAVSVALEAIALAGMVGVIRPDAEAARLSVMGNAMTLGNAGASLMGLLDTQGVLPKVVRA